MSVRLEIQACSRVSHARLGVVRTPHGAFETPAFMPVGTKASLKGLAPPLVADTGSQIVLANTYHLMLRPGSELIARRGGLHAFMCWPGPILTDSGGYQVYSLADTGSIDDDGVTFKSVVNGSMITMTPESSMRIQHELGADIIMAFDDCPPSVDPKHFNQARQRMMAARRGAFEKGYDHERRLTESMDRTARWLERCKRAHDGRQDVQSLFGIVQGGTDLDRRTKAVEQVCSVDLPGYAIGGVAVGEGFEDIVRVVAHTAPRLPEGKPRYLMGVGYEKDLLASVLAGVDMFDCVLPTRNGRSANAFTSTGQMRLKNARFAEDDRPIEPGCDCLACDPGAHGWAAPAVEGAASPGGGGSGGRFSRAYLRHLFIADEMLGPILVSLHNVRHFQRLMVDIRSTIRDDDWLGFVRRWPVCADALRGPVGDRLLESGGLPESDTRRQDASPGARPGGASEARP